MNPTFDAVLQHIADNPGISGVVLADTFPVDHRVYGRQRFTSSLIARFRKAGFIDDCTRCGFCNAAQTRGNRNVPLVITEAGRAYLTQGSR